MKMCPACVVVATSVVGLTAFAFLGGAAPATTATTALATAATAQAADVFNVDGGHSSVVFKVKHQKVADFYGRFNKVGGTFNLDAANPSASVLNITIDTASVDSNNSGRDTHLKKDDFFSAAEFPKITFAGKEFKKAGDSTYEVKGDLTLRGVTKSITVTVEDTGRASSAKGSIAGVGTTFKINRGDYGVNYGIEGEALGNEVTIMVGLEGKQ